MNCACNRVKSDRWSEDQCKACWKLRHIRAYQRGAGLPETGKYASWAEALGQPRPSRLPLVCIHEGNVLEYCTSCNSEAKHVRECDLHGKCTRDQLYLPDTRDSKGVLFLDDRIERWKRFQRHYLQATWARTRDDWTRALSRQWTTVFYDHDLCDTVNCDSQDWNGVIAAQLMIQAGCKPRQVYIHSTNKHGSQRIHDTLRAGGIGSEFTPFEDAGDRWKNVGVQPSPVRGCDKCPDHRRELFPDFPDPLWSHTTPSDEAAHIAAFEEIIANPPRYPGDNGERGIIWTCHSPKFWLMTAIGVRRLRALGCMLPVEVWYRSSCGELNVEDVAGLDVSLIDRDEMARRLKDSRLPFGVAEKGGWEVKTYAATHTRLKQFWILDSDALFIADPTEVIPDCPFGYWIDLPKWKTMTEWKKYGLDDHTDKVPQTQGGHLWFDKQAAWRFLAACHWANEHSDYFYSHSNHDQSIFRAALAGGACPDYRTFGDLGQPGGWVQKAHVCRYEGKPLIAHYCQGKLFEPESCDQVPGDRERLIEYARLILKTYR